MSEKTVEENGNSPLPPIEELPGSVKEAIDKLLKNRGVCEYSLKYEPASYVGENSYGAVLRLEIMPKRPVEELNGNFEPIEPIFYIVKVSPKNSARRQQMKVVEYYAREVFTYENVLDQFFKLQIECKIARSDAFNCVPEMCFYSLKDQDEFIVFEDLKRKGFLMFSRKSKLTYSHTKLALMELAKFHAMSFIMKDRKPDIFGKMVDEVRRDNLFTEDMEQISVEFGKKYINKTIKLIKEQQIPDRKHILHNLEIIRDNFKSICVKIVNGTLTEPYSVICHGDFWNNNMMYKYDESGTPIAATIIDFQMSRYASPVLDFVHYLFTCTEKELRDLYFEKLKSTYHESLSSHLRLFNLDPDKIFSYAKFEEHLKAFGVYGFCMSVYAVPFFISDSNDIPNLDEVSEAIRSKRESPDSFDSVSTSDTESDRSDRANALLEEFEILTDKTIPIFKQRMTGIVLDLEKYDMFHF